MLIGDMLVPRILAQQTGSKDKMLAGLRGKPNQGARNTQDTTLLLNDRRPGIMQCVRRGFGRGNVDNSRPGGSCVKVSAKTTKTLIL